MPSQSLIKEFQEAIKLDYGKDMSLEDAEIIFRDLLEYFSTLEKIYKSIKTSDG